MIGPSFDAYDEEINGPKPDPWKGIRDVDRARLFEVDANAPNATPVFAAQDPRRLDIAARALYESRQRVDAPVFIEPVMKRDRDALRRPLPLQ
ncbi:MAG: hypothetical protein WA030_00745 [Candidatus Microsaccharimonas sp.]